MSFLHLWLGFHFGCAFWLIARDQPEKQNPADRMQERTHGSSSLTLLYLWGQAGPKKVAGGMFALVSKHGKKTTKMGGFPLVSSLTNAEKARSFPKPKSAGTQSSGVTAKFAPQSSILWQVHLNPEGRFFFPPKGQIPGLGCPTSNTTHSTLPAESDPVERTAKKLGVCVCVLVFCSGTGKSPLSFGEGVRKPGTTF